MSKCLLCGAKSVINIQEQAARTIYNCPICGVYVVADAVQRDVVHNKAKIAAFMVHRKLLGQSDVVLISIERVATDKGYVHMTVQHIVQQFPRTLRERLVLTLQNLAGLSEYPGAEIRIDDLSQASIFYLEKYSFEALSYIIGALEKKGYLSVHFYEASFFPCSLTLTPDGWEEVERIESGADETQVLLCGCGTDNDYAADFRKTVTKVCKSCGYTVVDSAIINESAQITLRLLAQIRQARFVICDFSDASHEAYYAAGMAYALGKAVIATCRRKDKRKLKADPEELCTFFWDEPSELGTVLADVIRARAL